MSTTRTPKEQQARREVRVIARHLAHISREADPVKLAELHGALGRAISQAATSKLNGEPS